MAISGSLGFSSLWVDLLFLWHLDNAFLWEKIAVMNSYHLYQRPPKGPNTPNSPVPEVDIMAQRALKVEYYRKCFNRKITWSLWVCPWSCARRRPWTCWPAQNMLDLVDVHFQLLPLGHQHLPCPDSLPSRCCTAHTWNKKSQILFSTLCMGKDFGQ